MRGARFYRPDVSTKLDNCSEHIGSDCTDCCSVTPCAYCIELEIYGQDIAYGYAPKAAGHWTGTVSGYSFDAYWERNYTTDVCEFVVLFDGEEVYRQECRYISCRDSSDETQVTIGYDSATLRWIKHEPLPLPHVTSDTGCKTYFCGTCECSCDCLCVIIRDSYGEEVTRGEICTPDGYPCEGPVWQGPVGDYELSLALGRDTYGDCVITATVNGSETGTFAASGCKEMTATIELGDGKTAEVACKICDCTPALLCCGGRDLQGSLQLTLVNPGTGFGCGNTIFTLSEGGGGIWYASGTVSVEIPGGGGEECVDMTAHFRFFCDPGGPTYQLEWYFEYGGNRIPEAGWCGLEKASEDCDYPYLATWDENSEECGGFWNGVITFVVEET